ncbi:MAG: DNA polymerase III subunit gamma/tau, partial [Desulfovibrionaceae bacterium]|nr:DNA polymerase III subunit gamma/tau [Desulfovibrionaceae bacterium]
MKYISLATRYRPQRFDELAGQELIKTALSRASAENRVAPGYLLAGTRGVGKTTIARIFAKALNCEHAPCAEPCNECSACRRITQGSYPDVIEMDGASNNKVEDARELREKVGFAPMEGRYKIFIIDEAHMLTTQAFNALLKTLEEPPAHVVFIFATTEIHKFPTTILSRCQVFTFSHLQEETLIAHLCKVLDNEHIEYEENAVRLIAHRGAGSARDSMSLLDQVLSFGPSSLTADFVRSVLGLVSQDILENLLLALAGGNCGEVAVLTRELVSKQIDIRYFVSELTDTIRSLFLLHTCNRETVSRLGLSDNEIAVLERIAPKFTPGYLHAAWQMLLDSGRSLMPSSGQEPAAALEFLLVNMALLPRLLPAEVAGRMAGAANAGTGTQAVAAAAAAPVTTSATAPTAVQGKPYTPPHTPPQNRQQNAPQAVRHEASQAASPEAAGQRPAQKPAGWQQQQQAPLRQSQAGSGAQPSHAPVQADATAPAAARQDVAGKAAEAPGAKPVLSGQAAEGPSAVTSAGTSG